MRERALMITILLFGFILLSGCASNDLEEYQAAVKTTENIESGVMNMDLSMDLTFNEEGLSFEEERQLSYFDTIQFSFEAMYDDSQEAVIADSYYNFGGIGFDSRFFKEGDQLFLEMPVLKKYIDLSLIDMDAAMADNPYEDLIGRMNDDWLALLSEEDVLVGSKDYVMTDKGQIKTLTYEIQAGDDQVKSLLKNILAQVQSEENQDLLKEVGLSLDMEATESLLETMVLDQFEGRAYVDYDGRLVREVFKTKVHFEDPQPKDLQGMSFEMTTRFEQLGEEMTFDFPVLTKENTIQDDDYESIDEAIMDFMN